MHADVVVTRDSTPRDIVDVVQIGAQTSGADERFCVMLARMDCLLYPVLYIVPLSYFESPERKYWVPRPRAAHADVCLVRDLWVGEELRLIILRSGVQPTR